VYPLEIEAWTDFAVGIAGAGAALLMCTARPHRPAEQPLWSWLPNGVLPWVVLSLGTLLAGISLVADLRGSAGSTGSRWGRRWPGSAG
jgi:hypothetical protein